MARTKKQLKRIIEYGRAAQNDLHAIELRKTKLAREKLVGRCYKTRNSYGSNCRGWTMYIRVNKMDMDGDLSGFTFQKDSAGNFYINSKKVIYYPEDNYIKISEKVFNTAWKRFLTGCNKINA